VRCGRCGNENAENNRFCGMCGAPLSGQAVGPVRQASAPAGGVSAPRPSRTESAGRGVASAPAEARPRAAFEPKADVEPTISGPSFLGLNQPAPPRKDENHAGGWEQLRASRNLDYLLEDSEEEPKRGWGKLVLILVALALAGGFGYLRWKTGGFDWLTAGINKPAARQPAPGTAQPADNSTPQANPAPGTTSNESGASAAPSGTAAPNPAAHSAGTAGTAGTAAPAGAAAAPPEAAPVPGSSSATGTAVPSAPPATSQSATPPAGSAESPAQGYAATNGAGGPQQADGAQSNSGSAGAASSGTATPSQDEAAQPATPAAPPAAPKPRPSPRPVDSVSEAQRYIYGRGVRQDCDRGMHILKSAADRSDAKAMISLGALYSTGTCAPRDLPTAYRWFAMGLHKDPNNQALQDDLQKLWNQMTQPERQLAIKLSQ
jgi:zinc-ribbon domain